MKPGKAMRELLAELERQAKSKQDVVVPARETRVVSPQDTGSVLLVAPDVRRLPIREIAHGQLAEFVGVPKEYYDRMRSDARLLFDATVNWWLYHSEARRFVRLLDGQVRAILSDRYRKLDNAELVQQVIPLFEEHGVEIVSAEITERRFFIKGVSSRVAGEVKPGDVVHAGVTVSNSEVGWGALAIEPFAFFLACTNGVTIPDRTLKKHHVGRRHEEFDSSIGMFRDETVAAEDRAFWLRFRDTLEYCLKPHILRERIEAFRAAREDRIAATPDAVVEGIARRFRLQNAEKEATLLHFRSGHAGEEELNRFGAVQAVSRASQDVASYERATELEQMAGAILELPEPQWRSLAGAKE
jgi:hypothetical protein